MKKILFILFILYSYAQPSIASQQVFFNGNAANMIGTDGVAQYTNIISTGSNWSTTERTSVVSEAFTLKEFRIELESAPESPDSFTITIRKNSADTSTSCTISTTTTNCSSTTETSFSAGDTIGIKSVATGTVTTLGNSFWALRIDTTTTAASFYGSNTFTPHTTNQRWNIPFQTAVDTSASTKGLLVPTSGTFKNLYVKIATAPGSGKTFTYTITENGSNTALTCAISGTSATTCSDTSNSFTSVATDKIVMTITSSGTATTSLNTYSLTFIADTDGEFIIPGWANNLAAGNEYGQFMRGGGTATEVDAQGLSTELTIKKLYYFLNTAPGAGNSSTLTLRKDGADTALAVTISDTNQSGNSVTDVTASDDERWNVKQVEVTSSGSNPSYSILGYIAPAAGGTRRVFSVN